MFKIIDNFLSVSYLQDLQDYFLTPQCDWHFNPDITSNNTDKSNGAFGFAIRLHWNQMFVENRSGMLCRALILSSQDKVTEVTEVPHLVVRARADMTLYNPEKHVHEVHTDYSYEHTTAIFYLNTSDGNTLLYDREGKELLKEVEPIENRLLIFDGLLQHTGHSPSNHKCRTLLNMNFMTPNLIDELNNRHRN